MDLRDLLRRWSAIKSGFRSRRASPREQYIASQLIMCEFKGSFNNKKVRMPGLSKKLKQANSYSEMVDLVQDVFPTKQFLDMLRPCYKDLKKNEAIANILVQSGKECQSAAQHDLAMHCFTLGAHFAKSRSNLLLQIYWEFFKTAILSRDIDGANKLELAAKECSNFETYKAKFKNSIQNMWMSNLRMMEKNSEMDSFSENVLFKVYGKTSESTPEMGKCVVAKDCNTHGKGTFAETFLEPGTTVISERPYAATLIDCLNWKTNNCFACFKKITVGVPCEKCVFNIYCSVKCRNEDYKNGHKYECPVLPYLHCLESTKTVRMCLRIICRAGPETLFKAYQEIESPVDDDRCRNTIIKTPSGGVDKYSHILNLCSHPVEDTTPGNICLAYSIAYVMQKKTTFFRGYKGALKQVMVKFAAAILVRHLYAVPHNQFAIYDRLDPDARLCYQRTREAPKAELNAIGSGIYPVADILNHSCDPNVLRFQTSEGRLSVVTNRMLKPGTELRVSYGPVYSLVDKEFRQENLKKGFHFQCDCPACALDWPLGSELNKYRNAVLCPHCAHFKMFESASEDASEDASPCILIPSAKDSGQTGICDLCDRNYNLFDLKKEILEFEEKLKFANELVLSDTPLQAIPILKACIVFFQMTLCPPSHQLNRAQDLLDETLTLVSYK